MYISEEKAKEKWCPHGKADGSNMNISRSAQGNELEFEYPIKCITLGCMMWRSRGPEVAVPGTFRNTSAKEGYCGLAGRPV